MKKDFKYDKKYFNSWEFEHACSLIECNPQMALIELSEYIEKYPKDYAAYHAYIDILTILGKFDEAEKMIEYCERLVNDNSHFANFFDKVQKIKVNIIFDKLKLFSFQERYDELYQLFLNYHNYPEIKKLYNVKFYCMNKLGMINSKREDINGYIFKQMVEYNEKDFREYIKKHESLSMVNFELDKKSPYVFTLDFPLDKVIEEIKNNLYLENRLCYGFYNNIYVFKYNECGRLDNKMTDYIEAVCLNNTKDIINLHPASKCENMPYIDLNYLVDKKEDNKVKTKRLSQIDKFNRKYNIN